MRANFDPIFDSECIMRDIMCLYVFLSLLGGHNNPIQIQNAIIELIIVYPSLRLYKMQS